MNNVLTSTILPIVLFSMSAQSAVFKCADEFGNIAYQAKPCADIVKAIEIDIKTGKETDLSQQQKIKDKQLAVEEQEKRTKQLELELEIKIKQNAAAESVINQQMIKNNPVQYSAYAIPPYVFDDLPAWIRAYQSRLPEIEKMRRVAASKALATGECVRVEAAQLAQKSNAQQLVYAVDCSSAKTFYFKETELID